jgi:phage-related protein
MRTINFYLSENGKNPVQDFLDSLSDKQVSKVLWVLKLIRELDKVPAVYFKKLVNTDDIWEVRISSGSNIFRILGFTLEHSSIMLTNGFHKKQQETPKSEIILAESRKREYLSRRNKHGRS